MISPTLAAGAQIGHLRHDLLREVHASRKHITWRNPAATSGARCLPKAVDDRLSPRDRILEQCQEETKEQNLIYDFSEPLADICAAEREAEWRPMRVR